MWYRLKTLITTPADLAIFSAITLALSMIFSPFLLSVGIWLMVAAALWEARSATSGWGAALRFSWQRLVAQRALLAITLLFWVFALTYFWSDNSWFWLARTRIRIPFLVLPWAFANLPALGLRRYTGLIYVLVLTLCLFSAGSLINFAMDTETILSGLGEGQPMPVPRNHIRFSLMMVVAILSGGWLVGKRQFWVSASSRYWFSAAVCFLVISVHILSVRSALIALYAALGFTVFRFLFRTRQWVIGGIALTMIVLTPVVAYLSFSSLQQRMAYMLYDWQHFKSQAGGENYSDSERFISLDVGVRIWLENKVLGTGIGDLENETERITALYHPFYAETPKLPHNQFIYTLAATGIIGLLVSLVAFLYPLTIRRYRRFYLFAVFQVVIFVSFLVEYTLETSIGAAFFLFYQMWWMKMADENEE